MVWLRRVYVAVAHIDLYTISRIIITIILINIIILLIPLNICLLTRCAIPS